jgi:hypothetical protein
MRFAFVLAVVAIVISATEAADEGTGCPLFCWHGRDCRHCPGAPHCVSYGELVFFFQVTHQRGRSGWDAPAPRDGLDRGVRN